MIEPKRKALVAEPVYNQLPIHVGDDAHIVPKSRAEDRRGGACPSRKQMIFAVYMSKGIGSARDAEDCVPYKVLAIVYDLLPSQKAPLGKGSWLRSRLMSCLFNLFLVKRKHLWCEK